MLTSDTLSRIFRTSINSLASDGIWSLVSLRSCSVLAASRWINSETERGFARGTPDVLSAIRGNGSDCGGQDCDGNGGGGIEVGGEANQPVLSEPEDALRTPSEILFDDTLSDGVNSRERTLWANA